METAFEKAWFSSRPFHGTAEFASQVRNIEATQVAQLDAFELLPEPLARLKEGQRYLREQWGIDHRSLNGLSQLFKRHKTKLKTGRRRHRRADLAAQAAFKK